MKEISFYWDSKNRPKVDLGVGHPKKRRKNPENEAKAVMKDGKCCVKLAKKGER